MIPLRCIKTLQGGRDGKDVHFVKERSYLFSFDEEAQMFLSDGCEMGQGFSQYNHTLNALLMAYFALGEMVIEVVPDSKTSNLVRSRLERNQYIYVDAAGSVSSEIANAIQVFPASRSYTLYLKGRRGDIIWVDGEEFINLPVLERENHYATEQ